MHSQFVLYASKDHSFHEPNHLLCSWCLKQLRPLIWIKQLSFEHGGKISVREARWVVLFHEIYSPRFICSLPIPPKLLSSAVGGPSSIAGYRINAPVHKDPDFDLVVPRRERSLVQRIPVWLVLAIYHRNSEQNCTQTHNKTHFATLTARVGGATRITWSQLICSWMYTTTPPIAYC